MVRLLASRGAGNHAFYRPGICLPKAPSCRCNERDDNGSLGENASLQIWTYVPTPDDLICSALRGENPPWPWDAEEAAMDAVLERALVHGVRPLLHARTVSANWPSALVQSLRLAAVQHAMFELRHQQNLSHTLAELDTAGIQPVLVKGTALAYSVYSDPALRSRGDTDLLVAAHDKERTEHILLALGYERAPGVSGEFVSYQASYGRRTAQGESHTLDLHWKINNSELLSRLFTYEELRRDAQPLPALCPQALGASRIHALLLACMHRATHKQNPYYVGGKAQHAADRQIWLYDIHVLASGFNSDEWSEYSRLAGQKGLRATCLEGMLLAQKCFHTVYPLNLLAAFAKPGPIEAPTCYLNGSRLRQQWMDFAALGGFARQLQWLRELFLPPRAYMRSKYPDRPISWLPWLYLRRAADGLAKRLGRNNFGS